MLISAWVLGLVAVAGAVTALVARRFLRGATSRKKQLARVVEGGAATWILAKKRNRIRIRRSTPLVHSLVWSNN